MKIGIFQLDILICQRCNLHEQLHESEEQLDLTNFEVYDENFCHFMSFLLSYGYLTLFEK